MATIAERLLMVRGKTKQGEFAKLLNINPNTLRNYENGRVIPNQEVLERICVTFSVSAEWLLLGTGSMNIQLEHPNIVKECDNTVGNPELMYELKNRIAEIEKEKLELLNESLSREVNTLKENLTLRERDIVALQKTVEALLEQHISNKKGETIGDATEYAQAAHSINHSSNE